ncbi:polyadenylate-binding protein 8 [Drosophila guanche]|uniref:polyadenylate-binding protein 8 n=1 Tax=Drosophila guanche TaxID=7266 RepID=UPI0014709DAA|nr:polyadenylate-binding protein 8 [Drosophila guanche]
MSKKNSRRIFSSGEDKDQTQDSKPQMCENVGFVDAESVHLHACRREECSTKNFEAISGTLRSVGTQTGTQSDSSTIKIEQALVENFGNEQGIPKTNAAKWQWPKLNNYPKVKKEAPEASMVLASRAVYPFRIVNRMGFQFPWATLERQRCKRPCVHTANVTSIPLESVKIYIGNLSPLVKQEDIGQIFGHFGEMRTVEFPTDRNPINPQGRGFAFVQYVCPSDCARAIDYMNGCKFGDTFIVVSKIHKKPVHYNNIRYDTLSPRSHRSHRSNRDDSRRHRFPSSYHNSSWNRRELSRLPMRQRAVSPSSMSVLQSRHRAAYSPITPSKRSRRTNPATTGGPVMGLGAPKQENLQPFLAIKLENTDDAVMYPQSPGTATPQNLQPLLAIKLENTDDAVMYPQSPGTATPQNLQPLLAIKQENTDDAVMYPQSPGTATPQNLQPLLAIKQENTDDAMMYPQSPGTATPQNLQPLLAIKLENTDDAVMYPQSPGTATPQNLQPLLAIKLENTDDAMMYPQSPGTATPQNLQPLLVPMLENTDDAVMYPQSPGTATPQNLQPLLAIKLENTDNAVMYRKSAHRAYIEKFMNRCSNAKKKEAIADLLAASTMLRVKGERLLKLCQRSSRSGNSNQDTQ